MSGKAWNLCQARENAKTHAEENMEPFAEHDQPGAKRWKHAK